MAMATECNKHEFIVAIDVVGFRGANVESAKAAANTFPPGFIGLSLGKTAMKDRKAVQRLRLAHNGALW